MCTFRSDALEGNALGLPCEREASIYLPPGYFEPESDRRYPVVYMLHGYGGDARHPIVDTRQQFVRSTPLIMRLLFSGTLRSVITTERLDHLITTGVLPPFILVQPDGSLHVPQRAGGTHPGGAVRLKGSLYYDADGTGLFGTSVFRDAVDHVDATYRTIPDRRARAVIGGSMGGYGALLAGILHPDRFAAVAALSPSICGLDVLDLDLFVPFHRWIYGLRRAHEIGRANLADILDTCDMVYSPDRPLVPSIERDGAGRCIAMDEVARSRWAAADVGTLAVSRAGAFAGVAVRVSCEERDEFGFAGPDRRFCEALERRGIPHELVIFQDRRAQRISSHAVGIAAQVSAGLQFCLDHMLLSVS